MELNKFDSIKSLTTTQFDWKCRLRLQALWRGVNAKTKEFWGINMIFIDDSNDRIHAFASTKYCKDLINQVQEGKIYVVSNFRVKDYLGDETYRPVRNKKHIYFTTHTRIEEDVEGGLQIARHAFDLFCIGDMEKLAKDNRYLVDVVGQVQNVRAIKSTKNDSEKILTKFNISEGRKSVAVTLFDEVGTQFQKTLKCSADAEVYVIICAAKVGTYEGLPNLTNYPATRIYINPGHYSIQQITQRLFALKTEPVQSPPPEEINYPTLTVKQIQTLSSESNECKVNCQVKVTKVEEESSWFYAVCTKCPKEILRSEGVFKCVDCNRIIPYPDKRFRICTLCSDSTGSIAIIFPDDEVSRILDKTVFDLEAEAIQITANNLKKGSRVYEAHEILDKIESGASFDPAAPRDSEMADASTANLKDDNNNTPHTGISSTKTRPRVEIDAVAFDTGEDIPLQNMRNEKKKKNNAIHAFIPAASAHDLERQIKVGTVNIITGFTVQAYKDSDKFKIVQRAVQLIFSNDTKIQQVEDKGTKIPNEMFDFYDHSQVKDLADQTNVIGIMTDHEIHVNQITNRHGVQQEQAKFVITDGRSNLKVTLWDQYARDFVQKVWEKMETPVILILAGCRVQTWNSEVVLTHVASTKYYFNYNHHSVRQLRMMLSQPEFSMAVRGSNLSRKAELLTVQAIKSLGTDFIQRQVLTHVSIMQVDENQKWNITVCTSCDMEVENKDGSYFCSACERIVPYPDLRYRLVVLASDLTGTIEIVLHDREIRHLIGKRARQVVQEHSVSRIFPQCFKLMALKQFTIKLELHEANIVRKSNVYFATNICHGFKLEEQKTAANQTTTSTDLQTTSSTTQIPGLSDLNCDSSTTTKD
ncbi:hypothetical protein ACET3Z_001607 [Daucus carota]